MSLEKYKSFKKENFIEFQIYHFCHKVYGIFKYKSVSDRKAIEKKFKKLLGYKPNIDNPQSFQEKLQWLKLYDRKKWYSDCVDKYKVRSFIQSVLGTDEYLIPLVFVSKKSSDLKPSNFPDTAFVLKCNHDNNSWLLIKDKSLYDWKKIRSYYRHRLSVNLFWPNREWPYKNVQPCIMAEKYLQDKDGILKEYKFFCFNRKIKFIKYSEVYNGSSDRFFRYLNPDYTPLPSNYKIEESTNVLEQFTKPTNADEMNSIVNKISDKFEFFIRIDLFNVDGKCYIGELTFFDGAGYDKIVPNAWAETVSSYLTLPISK